MATVQPGESAPNTGDWPDLLAAPAILVGQLTRSQLPDSPGVYLWRRHGQLVYVGTATSLRRRVWDRHLRRGVNLSRSSLRRNVCEVLFQIPPNLTAQPTAQKVTADQAAAIRDWLAECELSWQPCASAEEAKELEKRLRSVFLPMLNRT